MTGRHQKGCHIAACPFVIAATVLLAVERVLPLMSPVYDLGTTEAEVERRWEERPAAVMRARRSHSGIGQVHMDR